MKFALFLPASWVDKDTVHQSRIYGEVLEQVQYAEELGFDSIWNAFAGRVDRALSARRWCR